MKTKKLVSIVLLIVIFMSQLSLIPFNSFVFAISEEITDNTRVRFHYDQLAKNTDSKSKMAVKLYNVMYEMYINGELKTGTASRDIAQDGIITQEELTNYVRGDKSLTDGMNAARYAFYADYPEIFYVDFSRLSLRVTHSADGYHATLGSGKYTNYYVDGFKTKADVDTAIQEFDTRVNEIVRKAEEKNDVEEKIKYVHDEIITKVSYRYEDECYNGNQGFLGTPYGTLVKRQSVCEGYSRTFKTIMDKLGITCILVQGVHQYSGEVAVAHMWNYVKIPGKARTALAGKWYAVDCTQDDPCAAISEFSERADYIKFIDNMEGGENYGLDGFENKKYLLAGAITMQQRHTVNPVIEAAGDYEFEYPILEDENLRADVSANTDGFKIVTQPYEEDEIYGDGKITGLKVVFSYMNMSVESAQKQGIYVLARWLDTEEFENSKWIYMIPGGMAFENSEDGTTSSFITGASKYLQFAVTDKKYSETGNLEDLIYKGTEKELIAKSERVYNPYHEYQPAPYIVKQSPNQTSTITIRKTPYKVSATWDKQVVEKEGEELSARVSCSSVLGTATTGEQESKIENIVFDEATNTVTFDFTFSQMWADDAITYSIYIDGLEAEDSKKAPNPIVLSGENPKGECITKQAMKGAWNLYARPTLIENDDLSMENWVTSNGQGVSDLLRNRIALVTTTTTRKEQKQIDEKIKETFPDEEIVKSSTYNIALTICKNNIKKIKNGHKITMKVGFPEGCGPESVGVTYKAYHFSKDANGNVIGVDELECVVTPYGLIITCDAFSPFTIAAVKDDKIVPNIKKSLIATSEECGRISVTLNKDESTTGNLLALEEGDTATINITPDEGYQIDTVTVCGEMVDLSKQKATSKETTQITVNYDEIKDENSIVHATFVAKEVAQEEIENNQTVVVVEPEQATIEMPSKTAAGLNNKLIIKPEVSETNGIQTYQWYKDDVKLEGKTNKILEIENVNIEHKGTYTLKVTTTLNTLSTVSEKSCEVSIASINIGMKKSTENVLRPGDQIELTLSINNLSNVTKGLVNFGGKLIFDNNVLELNKIEGLNEWDIKDSYNPESKKFVIDNDRKVTSAEDILKITFTVKDYEELIPNTEVRIEEIAASDAEIDIGVEDAKATIEINLAEEEPKITSDLYNVYNDEGFITRILPTTTISEFKKNITTNTDLVFIKDGNTLSDTNIIETNTVLKVGELEYVLSVIGDIDGKYNETQGSSITLTDLGQLKLHYIESKQITLSEASKKSADINGDGKITLLDLAQLKLVLIGEMEIK